MTQNLGNTIQKRSLDESLEDDVKSKKTSLNDTIHNKINVDEDMGEFEDPYGDDFDDSDEEIFEAGDEDIDDVEDEDKVGDLIENSQQRAMKTIKEDEDTNETETDTSKKPLSNKQQIYLPGISQPLGPDEVLEPDLSTYDMLHTVNVTWPCLSFDILEDNLGDQRRSYPHSAYIVTGTQAQKARDNEITVMKFSSLNKTLLKDDDDSEDEDDEYTDPILETKSLPTMSTTNRIRVTPFAKQTNQYLTASMAENGDVYVWDITPHFKSFDTPGTIVTKQMSKPIHTITSHGHSEGYALDWSPLITTGSLLTGDVDGRIFLTNRTQTGWTDNKQPFLGHNGSVEEIQWSKSERTVFASGGSDGFIRVWDIRSKSHKPIISVKASSSDVNVMSWSGINTFLLASGHDDGSWSMWDLRNFSPKDTKSNSVASFDFLKQPITSIEFHPTEDSNIAVASEGHTVTLWDLAVEADDDEIKKQLEGDNNVLANIPPQLLFVHYQRDAKEVHWNKQIPGSLISTGSDGFSIWKSISV
ncbi:uncharacterized protein SAPINGB_P003295 [Magnusiomyces paraingens]|uniref:Histone-binding protein RBBP4-like N-terminal domain-containing protein n=1 Tax=Magnusiomyces paraingens TaxID=2606893 RepID=A0A5E8BTJ9_9ASCO|nr:uncharacterized protein SAPINGB_P003295 [Saprochaete ingens]VVT52035.1 unnamed protein product [Saprochaete ingens]